MESGIMHKKKNIKFKIITGVAAAGTVIVISVAVITGLGRANLKNTVSI